MRAFILMLGTVFLVACSSEMQVTTTLNSTKDIQSGDAVYLSGTAVAEVTKVVQQAGKTTLTLELNNQGESAIKQNAAIVVNRLKAESPIEIYNKQGETELVQDGAELQGLNSMFQLGAWMVGDSLAVGKGNLSEYVDAFQRYLNGDEFQQDKQAMQDAAKQLGKEVQGAAQVLTEEAKRVTKDLGITEQKAAEAIEQLGNELAPVLNEFSKSGQAVVEELEKFSENMEAQNLEGKELGSTILSSLLKTLEQVNNSLEEPNSAQNKQPAEDAQPNTLNEFKATPPPVEPKPAEEK